MRFAECLSTEWRFHISYDTAFHCHYIKPDIGNNDCMWLAVNCETLYVPNTLTLTNEPCYMVNKTIAVVRSIHTRNPDLSMDFTPRTRINQDGGCMAHCFTLVLLNRVYCIPWCLLRNEWVIQLHKGICEGLPRNQVKFYGYGLL